VSKVELGKAEASVIGQGGKKGKKKKKAKATSRKR